MGSSSVSAHGVSVFITSVCFSLMSSSGLNAGTNTDGAVVAVVASSGATDGAGDVGAALALIINGISCFPFPLPIPVLFCAPTFTPSFFTILERFACLAMYGDAPCISLSLSLFLSLLSGGVSLPCRARLSLAEPPPPSDNANPKIYPDRVELLFS